MALAKARFRARWSRPFAGWPGTHVGDVGLEQHRHHLLGDGRVVEAQAHLGIAVHRPRVEVERADEHPIVGDDHLGVDDRGVLPDLDAGGEHLVVHVKEGPIRDRVPMRRVGDHQPDVDAAASGGKDLADDDRDRRCSSS